MVRCNAFALLALGVGTMALPAQAQQQQPSEPAPPADLQAVEAAAAAVEAAEPRTPIMQLLDRTGFGKTLDDYNISIGGWLEASTTWSLLDDPAGDEIVGRSFDFEHADPTFNQFGLTIIRPVDNEKDDWDVGFTIEHIFGADARFTASNGMDFQTGDSPENQFDITQAFVEVYVPVGKGLTVKAGKWITPIGYEYVNPTLNPLYSHSYLFGIVPYSHTGVMCTYPVSDTSTLGVGIARGWEQSLKDNNGAVELVWTFANEPSDQLSYAFNGSVGPQNDDDSGHYRTMLDYWMDYACSDQFSIGLNVDYRYDSSDGQDGDAAHTYGVAGYFKHECNKYVTGVVRLEWFNDTSRTEGFDCNIYAATLGVTVTPFPNDSLGQFLKIRPEIRYDYATEPTFDGGDDNNLLTFAIEGVFTL